jgi:anti-sigma regulatory factor (Ser/Thr protein kinase)
MSPLPVALDLLAVPRAVPEARRTLRERCGGADSPDLLLCVSELLTNAIVHLGEGTPVTLRVSGTSTGRVRVELSDPEPGAWPVIRSAAGGDESGRGLALVDALALRWGVEQGPYGKTVWCELRASERASGRWRDESGGPPLGAVGAVKGGPVKGVSAG